MLSRILGRGAEVAVEEGWACQGEPQGTGVEVGGVVSRAAAGEEGDECIFEYGELYLHGKIGKAEKGGRCHGAGVWRCGGSGDLKVRVRFKAI